MAYTYQVNYGTSSSGPWTTAATGLTNPSDTITGLVAGTAYYFQIIATDAVTGLSSAPVVSGPYSTASQINSISLSSLTFTGGGASTVVGAVSVNTSPSGVFSGTLSLPSGTAQNSYFTLSSPTLPSNLVANANVPGTSTGTPYNISITANESGFLGSPFSQSLTVTSIVTISVSPPGFTVGTINATAISGTASPVIYGYATPGATSGSINAYNITAAGTINCNGTALGGASVVALYSIGNCIYQQNTGGYWYGPLTSTATGYGQLTGSPVPTITGITFTPTSPIPTALNGGTSVGTIAVNGTAWTYPTTSSGSVNAFTYNGNITLGSGNVLGESANGTTITNTTNTIVGSSTPGTPGVQNTWQLTSAGTINVTSGGVTYNGGGGTDAATTLLYFNHCCFQQNATGQWYGPMTFATSGFGPGPISYGNPVATVPNFNMFTLTGSTITVSSTDNLPLPSVLGFPAYTIGATCTPGTFNGVTVSFGPASGNWNGSGQQLVSVSVTGAAPALAAAAGFTQLVFADDFTTTTTVAPNFAGTQTLQTGYNFYWNSAATGFPSINTTQTAAQLSNGNNGGGSNASPNGGILTIVGNSTDNNSGGGGNYESVCNFTQYNEAWYAPGAFLYGYFECYVQYNPQTTPYSGGTWPGFWFGDLYSAYNGNNGQGNANLGSLVGAYNLPARTEFDWFEFAHGTTPFTWSPALHYWPPGTGNMVSTIPYITPPSSDANWHTYSMLWVPTGTNTTATTTSASNNSATINVNTANLVVGGNVSGPGIVGNPAILSITNSSSLVLTFPQTVGANVTLTFTPGTSQVSFYCDNVSSQIGTVTLGPNTSNPQFSGNPYFPYASYWPLYIIMQSAIGFPTYCDWIRVWQIPGSTVVNTPAIINLPASYQ